MEEGSDHHSHRLGGDKESGLREMTPSATEDIKKKKGLESLLYIKSAPNLPLLTPRNTISLFLLFFSILQHCELIILQCGKGRGALCNLLKIS